MKIIIEDGHFSYQVDWAKDPLLEEDDLVPVDDCIESFCRLLENIYSAEKIADCLAEGLDAMEYSKKGLEALERLRKKTS